MPQPRAARGSLPFDDSLFGSRSAPRALGRRCGGPTDPLQFRGTRGRRDARAEFPPSHQVGKLAELSLLGRVLGLAEVVQMHAVKVNRLVTTTKIDLLAAVAALLL